MEHLLSQIFNQKNFHVELVIRDYYASIIWERRERMSWLIDSDGSYCNGFKCCMWLLFYSNLIFLISIKNVEATGKIAVRLLQYSNPDGLLYAGTCCDGTTTIFPSPLCSQQCNTQLSLCIDSYQR